MPAADGEERRGHGCWYLCEVARPGVVHLYVDRASTVARLERGRLCATGMARPGARLWGRFFATCELGDYVAHEIPARCPWSQVMGGKIAPAQRAGNRRADRCAKRGAALRAPPDEAVLHLKVLAVVFAELARWIAQASIILQDLGSRDTEGVPEGEARRRPRIDFGDVDFGEQPKRLRAEPMTATAARRGLGAGAASTVAGHAIRFALADEKNGQEVKLAGCKVCGAHPPSGAAGPTLRSQCPGAAADRERASLRNQLGCWAMGQAPGRPRRSALQGGARR